MRVLFVSASLERAHAIIDPIIPELQKCAVTWDFSANDKAISPAYDLAYLLSYDRVIDPAVIARIDGRAIVFHSSDLPQGRGWAPIYTAIASGRHIHTISMIYAAEKPDTGNILAKARLPIAPNYTAEMLRAAGQKVIGQMIARYTHRFDGHKPCGQPQSQPASYVKRRTPADSMCDAREPLLGLMPHILASEAPNNAMLEYRGARFRIVAIPEDQTISEEFTLEEFFSS